MAKRVFSNLEFLELDINSETGRAEFPNDRLFVGKKINRMFFFLNNSNVSKTPFGDDVLTENTATPTYTANIYVNLYDKDNNKFMRNFNALFLQPFFCYDITIDRVVDFNLSYVEFSGIPTANVGNKIAVLIQYEDEIQDAILTPTNLLSITIEADSKTQYNLLDYIGKQLDEKKIYAIQAGYKNSGVCETAYLTIRDKYSRVFNDIPLCVFSQYANAQNWSGYPEFQYVNAISIDAENSYITAPNGLDSDITITFYYEEY